MRISDWSSDVCSSDLARDERRALGGWNDAQPVGLVLIRRQLGDELVVRHACGGCQPRFGLDPRADFLGDRARRAEPANILGDVEIRFVRSEEHTSELQSLMRISYAVFCLKKKK